MPIYEYECQKCHHRFEKIQSFSDPKIKQCPKCKGPVEQVLTAPAVQFKGSGWYVTDYARKSSAGSSSSNSEGESKKSEEKSETKSKSESKPKPESSSKMGEKK